MPCRLKVLLSDCTPISYPDGMIEREITPRLKALFEQYPFVTVTGPRQSGKTTLCRAAFPNLAYANLEALDQRNFADTDPREFLAQLGEGAIIDEIQRVPDLLSYLQVMADERRQNGMYVLTGSEQFQLSDAIGQSLAGRTALLKQVVVLSHSRSFLAQIYEQRGNVNVIGLRLARDGEASSLKAWSVADAAATDHDERYALFRRYQKSENVDKRGVAQALRPHLERFLRVAYPGEFPAGYPLPVFEGQCDKVLNPADV